MIEVSMKRTSMICILILSALHHAAAGQKRMIFDPNGGEFQISGDRPAGFEDFSRMNLETRTFKGRRVRPNGEIEFGQASYAMRNIVFDGRRWNFETVPFGGTSFRFYGRFPKLRLDEHGAIIGDNVLQGHLIKFVHGKKAAEADLVFSFIYYSD